MAIDLSYIIPPVDKSAIKKELMNHEFMINMKLKNMELNVNKQKEDGKEDRKDERTRIQASQQSQPS